MRSSRWLPLLAVTTLGLGSCDSKVTSTLDSDIQARIESVQDCFPSLWTFVDGLTQIANTWKLQDAAAADPAGLGLTVNGDGSITATLAVNTSTVSMTIKFYGPNGAEQDLTSVIAAPSTLSAKIDAAATELRNRFGTGEKFIHGVYSISGGGVSATSEALTGLIGGATNQNELASLRTTVATVTTGIPDVESTVITDTSSTPNCTLTFNIADLITDEEPAQEYPRGTITIEINDGTTTTGASIVFDKSSVAQIRIDNTPGRFDLDLDTLTLTAQF